MDTSSVALYVNQIGAVPATPVHVTLPSLNPTGLAKILAAIGLEVREGKTAEGTDAFVARTVNTLVTVPQEPQPSDRSVVSLFFLVEQLEAKIEAVIAQGALLTQDIHRSSWGRRAVLTDFDKRKIFLTERTASGTPFPTDQEIHETAIADIWADEPEEEATEWSVESRRSMAVHRIGAWMSLVAAVGGLLSGCALTIASLTTNPPDLRHLAIYRLDFSQAAPAVITLLLSLVLSIAGKVFCLDDRGRSAGISGLITATILEIAALIIGGCVLPLSREAAPVIIGLCELPATVLFTCYWREIGTAFDLAKLPTTANYSHTAWKVTIVLFILLIGVVFDFDILDPIADLLRIGFCISCFVSAVLYVATLFQAVVQLHKQLAAAREGGPS